LLLRTELTPRSRRHSSCSGHHHAPGKRHAVNPGPAGRSTPTSAARTPLTASPLPTPGRCAFSAHRPVPHRRCRHAPRHHEPQRCAPSTQEDPEKTPNRDKPYPRNNTTPKTNRTEHRRCTTRKETPPPQARTDPDQKPERPEPTRRRASGGASSFTRFFRFLASGLASAGPSSLTRRNPDELGGLVGGARRIRRVAIPSGAW